MKHWTIWIVALLALGACSAEDLDSDTSAANALPLTKRQAAEILLRADCTRIYYCYNRDAHAVGHHTPSEGSYVQSCVVESVRAYCHDPDDTTFCAATTTTTLEGANACAAVINDDSQLCLETKYAGCYYAILDVPPPF